MEQALQKLSKKIYYALVYRERNSFAALDRDTGNHYPVDDISLAWLRRNPIEFFDYAKVHDELAVVKIDFTLEVIEE